jgi:hypothetical protein
VGWVGVRICWLLAFGKQTWRVLFESFDRTEGLVMLTEKMGDAGMEPGSDRCWTGRRWLGQSYLAVLGRIDYIHIRPGKGKC